MKALVIDDEPQIRRALRVGLEHNGYDVELAATGEEGLDAAAGRAPDFVVLDLALPDGDGVAVCRQLRSWSAVPMIVLSVRDGEREKIEALDAGADDYLTKPFSLDELLARVRAVLRRAGSDKPGEEAVFTCGELSVDFGRRQVRLQGNELHLTPIEYELLKFMSQHPDRVLTHRHLLKAVWGAEYENDIHTLRVHIANLRNKIEPDPARPRFLHTEPRIGYRFRVEG